MQSKPAAPPRYAPHVAVKECRRGTFIYNVNDSFIGRSLDLYGEWCEDELFVLDQILAPGAVAIDVGANIGTHAVSFAKRVGPNGAVFAFEPQRLVFQMLCGNVAINGLTNVRAQQSAVGAACGASRIPVLDPGATINFGAVKTAIVEGGEHVDVVTIDHLHLRRCNLIKVDVEGMEVDVLKGARETIERCRPTLFLENDTIERSHALLTEVRAIGYKAYWHIAHYFNPKNFFAHSTNVFEAIQPQGNILCVPEGASLNGLEATEGLDDDWTKALERLGRRESRSAR